MAKILLVEDELVSRLVIRFLSEAGHDVTTVEYGREALALLEANWFDMVITALDRPGMNGIEFAQKIRASESSEISALPLIITSGYGTWDEMTIEDYCAELGASFHHKEDDWIRKLPGLVHRVLQAA